MRRKFINKALNRFLVLLVILLSLVNVIISQDDEAIEIATPNLISEGIPKVPKSLIVDLYNSLKRRQSSFITFKTDGSILAYNENYNPFILTPGGEQKNYQIDLNVPEDIELQPNSEAAFIYTADNGGDENKQLFIYDFETKKKSQLTDNPTIKTVSSYTWSKNGDLIYFTNADRKNRTTDIYSINPKTQELLKLANIKGDNNYISDVNKDFVAFYNYVSNNHTEYFLLNLADKNITQITKEAAFFKQARFVDSTNSLYFLSDKEGKFFNLYSLNLKTKAVRKINQTELNISSYKISPDQKQLAFKINDAGAEFIKIFQLEENKTIKELANPATPPGVIERFGWKNNEEIGFTFESLKNPPEIKVFNLKTKELKIVSKGLGNSSIIQNLEDTQILKWKSFDNREISGLISKPKNIPAGVKLPVIIDIHGGPKLQYQPYYSVFKTYATAKLKAVTIYPNIRGSSGFGREFESLDNLEKREDALKDVEALLDWIKTQSDLDPSKIVLKGESYGGFVALATGLRNQNKIKGVIAEKPVISLKNTADYSPQSIKEMLSFEYGLSSNQVLMEKIEQLSPLFKDNLSKWKIPVFLSIGQNDVRVPIADVENLKNQLKAKGIAVWFLKAKNEGHFWSEFENNVFLNVAEIDFLKVQGGF
ncbi:MAG TPA: prolyl oligopeptidase family serine peptidase [Pyrinomonadaceae bacterium]|nr:prolyl oligopeptidase family serine peptidase [Pyrinomonadaceae bacterium]